MEYEIITEAEIIPNIEKSNTDFDEWLNKSIPSPALGDYKKKHYIPNVDLSLPNFGSFFAKREALMIEALSNELKV